MEMLRYKNSPRKPWGRPGKQLSYPPGSRQTYSEQNDFPQSFLVTSIGAAGNKGERETKQREGFLILTISHESDSGKVPGWAAVRPLFQYQQPDPTESLPQ